MICKKPDSCKIISILVFLIVFELFFINFPKFLEKPIYFDIYNINFISTQKIYREFVPNKSNRISHNPFYRHNFSTILHKLDIYPTKPSVQNLINFKFVNNKLAKNIDVWQLIIVQLHNRPQNIEALLTSLQKSQYINNSIIIFSSDCYSPKTINILENIKFVSYAHIRYPLSQEVFLESFKQKVLRFVDSHENIFFPPEKDASPHTQKIADCAKVLLKEWIIACESYQAIALERLKTFITSTQKPVEDVELLNNVSLGQSASPKFGLNLIKHHWWWKLNAIFGKGELAITLTIPNASNKYYNYRTADYTGPVVFLEEDYYVLPDAFHILKQAWPHLNPSWTHRDWSPINNEKLNTTSHLNWEGKFDKFEGPVKLLSLGNYEPVIAEQRTVDKKGFIDKYTTTTSGATLDQAQWRSAFHNLGMVWDRRLWLSTFASSGNNALWARTFCTYDDYNWDWTVNRLFRTMIDFPVYAVFPALPRILHIGVCGVHQKTQPNQSSGALRSQCSPAWMVDKIEAWIAVKASKGIFFPPTLRFLEHGSYLDYGPVNPNGGWASKQDHELCLNAAVQVGGIRV